MIWPTSLEEEPGEILRNLQTLKAENENPTQVLPAEATVLTSIQNSLSSTHSFLDTVCAYVEPIQEYK